jgi:polysaccharide export outer membrane protein
LHLEGVLADNPILSFRICTFQMFQGVNVAAERYERGASNIERCGNCLLCPRERSKNNRHSQSNGTKDHNSQWTAGMRPKITLLFLLLNVTVLTQGADVPTVMPSSGEPTLDYRLGPEDVIEVFVWKEPDLSTTVTIRPDGKISLPLANELEASGKTAAELQQEIVVRLQRYITQPVVNVMVKQINSLKISVLGEVRKPDVYKIKNRLTVLDAIAMAGGFTDLARPNRVIVLRNSVSGLQRITININQVVSEQHGTPFFLQPLDTVYVEGR